MLLACVLKHHGSKDPDDLILSSHTGVARNLNILDLLVCSDAIWCHSKEEFDDWLLDTTNSTPRPW